MSSEIGVELEDTSANKKQKRALVSFSIGIEVSCHYKHLPLHSVI